MNSATEPSAVTIRGIDEAGLARLAGRLANVLPARAFLALTGDLGAGKTTLVKALAAAEGIDPTEIVSPTFGLLHEHEPPEPRVGGPARILHADLYRLSGIDDLAETGWDDAVAASGWVLAEWPERIVSALPPDRLDIVIEIESPTMRTITLRATGPAHAPVPAALSRA